MRTIGSLAAVITLVVLFIYPAVLWDPFGLNNGGYNGQQASSQEEKCPNGYLLANNCQPAPGATATPRVTTPSATATPQTGQLPTTGGPGKTDCPTNSPNIPCVIAQGQANGFTPFAVDGITVGGPAEQWWPLQRADGNFVPNSFKMVGMRQTDRGLPGYEMHVPQGMIMDVWLDNSALTNRKTAVRVYGPANIKADFRVAEATLYTRPVDHVASLSGKWARLSDSYQCGDYVDVGTVPPAIASPHDCHQATASGGVSPSTGPAPSAVDKSPQGLAASLGLPASCVTNKALPPNGAEFSCPGGVSFTVPNGFVVVSPQGRAVAGQKVNADIFSVYDER